MGISLRNEGRYLWNCSTVGRTGPEVKLMQYFKHLKAPANRGALDGNVSGQQLLLLL